MFQQHEDRFKEGESDRGNKGGINVTCTLRKIQPYKLTSKGPGRRERYILYQGPEARGRVEWGTGLYSTFAQSHMVHSPLDRTQVARPPVPSLKLRN